MISSFKSVGLALLTLNGHLPVTEALKLSRVEENCQIEEHGFVEGAHDVDEISLEQSALAARIIYGLSNHN